ncbi:hypothetical protein PR003_g15367 [Phytophthora rubi]|uniref:RxLR effector protein n=1 Tax=Phytophthora rubi TaxID=129364 RepID=A0A6A4EZY0_9STRA|nr:hypothetical protein PR001_g14494 [Phytophthora rubi]KAE9330208.1 hypothetical protein PR003_g15367 [Phytophthora rubi]
MSRHVLACHVVMIFCHFVLLTTAASSFDSAVPTKSTPGVCHLPRHTRHQVYRPQALRQCVQAHQEEIDSTALSPKHMLAVHVP